ncbi:AAA ATPase midasin, partial [Coemansia sp. RSA 2049]
PGGVLHVTEDPKRTAPVVPHPNFRIVMAVDPMHGELSRAMRNRGIEICVLPPPIDSGTGTGSADQAVVARSVGLSSSLVPSDMLPPHATLTAVAHQAVRVAERTQRGYAARLVGDGCAAALLASYYAPTARGSSVSVARWQAHLARRAMTSGTARERQALLVAAIGTLPPGADSFGAALFSAILASDCNAQESAVVAALLAAPLAGAVRQARAQVAVECQLSTEILRSAPSLVPLNAALHRALQRNIAGNSFAARWHQVLCAALVFQRERIAAMPGAADAVGSNAVLPATSASARRAALLRQPDADVAHLQRVLGVADGCDLLIDEWEASVASLGSATAAGDCSADSDLGSCVPVLRSLYRLAMRIRQLVAGENENGGSAGDNSSALAVAFEETQTALHQMLALTRSQPGSVGAQIQLTLGRVRPLVLDAAHSARLWLLVHPVTLCDANERQIEARLRAAHKHIMATTDMHPLAQSVVFSAEMREAVVEAIAMLYATVSSRGNGRSRRLVVDAIARFADSLPAIDASGAQAEGDTSDVSSVGMSLAAVLGDIRTLADWQQVAQLAVLASGSSNHMTGRNDSSLQDLSIARLRTAVVSSMSVGSESPWAPVFARLSWSLNEHGRAAAKPENKKRGGEMLASALPLAIDIIDQWHDQLHSQTVAGVLSDSSAALLRLARPVATELTWRHSAGLLDCALEDHGGARDGVVGMLRALATYTPPSPAPSRDLAALVWLLAVAAVAVCDTAEEDSCAELHRLSSALASALLHTSDSSSLDIEAAAGRWRVALDRVTNTDGRVALCISPAADAVCAAAAQNSTAARRGVLAATIAVHSGMLELSVPHRAVDPAARAHTRWEWLGDDIDTARAQLAAIRDVQRAMTGDTDTAATRPLAADVAALEARQSGIDRVFRPPPSGRDAAAPFAELWHEARTLCAGVLGRVRDVCAQLLQGDELPLAAADALVATLAQFQARVRARYYAAFRDVAQIWCVHARSIAYALAQLADECRRTDPRTAVHRETARLVAEIYAMPAAGGVPATEASNAETQRALARLKAAAFFAPKQQTDDGANAAGGGSSKGRALRMYGELVRALLLRTVLGVQARGRLAAPDVAALDAVFRDAHDIHHRAVEAKRKRDAEAASLFKLRARPDPTDDELVRELFPGYEELFADEESEESGGPSAGDSGGEAAAGGSPADDDLDGDTVAAVAACHQYVMLQFGTSGCAPDLRPSLVREARRAALQLAASAHSVRRDTASMLPDGADAELRAANMAALADAVSATDSASSSSSHQPDAASGTRTTRVRDFYRDPWPSESVRARPVAQAIRARAAALLQEWPDHAGLQLIRDAATRVLAQAATAPVARVLAGVEQLYARAQESWEAHAARETSLGAELEEAARLVVRWRQLELNAWPHVLRAQELACARRVAAEWWFSLYAVLVAASDEAAATGAELAAALDRFAHGCPAGEFRARLNLLLAFAAHRAAIVAARTLAASAEPERCVADALRADPVYAPLRNAVAYYLQFAPAVADHLARGKQPIARDLAQYVRISAWKDANPAALRASAQRTHRHLAKCVRRLRDTLEQPVFQIIQAHQAASVATAGVPHIVLVSTPLADAGVEAAPAAPPLEAAARQGAPAAWMPGRREPDAEDAMRVAALARLADPAVAEVVGASAGSLVRLRRMLEASRLVGRSRVAAEAADVFGDFARQAAADIHYFQSMETPQRLLAGKKSGSGSAGKGASKKQNPRPRPRGKHVIGGGAAEDAASPDDGAEVDEEERQRLVRRFWGEQRNLRRTRLKEILRGMQDLGLKRHFRASTQASAPAEEAGGTEGTASGASSKAAAPGLGAQLPLLQLRPLDTASWQSAVSQASAADGQLVLSASAAATLRSLRTADAAFFQLAARMSQLRAAAFDDARSPEVPGAQVRAITGLVECLHSLVVGDRQCAAELVADAATLMGAASAWGGDSLPADPGSNASGSFVVAELKLAADSAMAQLTQLLADVDAVCGAGGWDPACAGAAECAVGRIRAAADQFAAAHALLGTASAMATALAMSGVDALTADICASASPAVAAAREALATAAHAVAQALRLSRTGLDPRMLDPWVQPALASVGRVVEQLGASAADAGAAEASGANGHAWGSAAAATAGRWITGVMGVWQAVRSTEAASSLASADERRNIWGLAPKEL